MALFDVRKAIEAVRHTLDQCMTHADGAEQLKAKSQTISQALLLHKLAFKDLGFFHRHPYPTQKRNQKYNKEHEIWIWVWPHVRFERRKTGLDVRGGKRKIDGIVCFTPTHLVRP